MNAAGHGQRLRLYRLWRTAAILCALGAVEIAVLAWQRQQPWLASVCLPLVAVAVWAARRGGTLRRTL
jgi:lysylphosphatidylglycerol synthetase-like protein (DUF2156 family)